MSNWSVPLYGTVVDVVAVIVAGILGLLLKKKLEKRLNDAIVVALGLSAIPLGVMMFLEKVNPIIVLICVTLGYLLGTWLRVEDRLEKFGDFLKSLTEKIGFMRNGSDRSDFINAFVIATAVSLIGPLAVMGPLMEGLTHDPELMLTKTVFDFFATFVFAASLGQGVIFSAIPIFIFQAVLALGSSLFSPIFLPEGCTYQMAFDIVRESVTSGCLPGRLLVDEMTAVGGVLIMAMGIKVSGIKEMPVANFLPAIPLALLVTYVVNLPIW
jgi:hypothetical protein